MLPKVVTIAFDVAWCETCGDRVRRSGREPDRQSSEPDRPLSSFDTVTMIPFLRAIESIGCPGELTLARGITFWTPPPTLPDYDVFMRWLDLREIIDHPLHPGNG